MAKHRVMLDQMRVGNKLEGIESAIRSSLPISGTEAGTIREILRKITKRDLNEKGELHIDIFSKAGMRLTLRRDRRDKKVWYLNLDGNPLKFITGKNIYGWPNAGKQIVWVFKKCLKAIERQSQMAVPERIWTEVKARRIHLNHLEFASYTFPIDNKEKVLNGWRYMFDSTKKLEEETGMHLSLDHLLGVRSTTKWPTSFMVDVVNRHGAKELMFMAYDKVAEQQRRMTNDEELKMVYDVKADEWEKDYGTSQEALPEDIHNRLRLEIGLTSVWFNNRGIKTLVDMEKHIRNRYENSWIKMVEQQARFVMERACLMEMWSFPRGPVLDAYEKGLSVVPEFGPRFPTDVWVSMLDARDAAHLTTADKALKARDPEKFGRQQAKLRRRLDSALSQHQLRRIAIDKSQPQLGAT